MVAMKPNLEQSTLTAAQRVVGVGPGPRLGGRSGPVAVGDVHRPPRPRTR
ncbi:MULTISPECIES: hypothetical protein [Streptomyces]